MLLAHVPSDTLVKVEKMDLSRRVVSKLAQLGIREGSELLVERFAPLDGPVMVKVENREVALSRKLAHKIEVDQA